ncbi:quinone oxidoreductase-like protein 2 isoform X8 [Panthera onca]
MIYCFYCFLSSPAGSTTREPGALGARTPRGPRTPLRHLGTHGAPRVGWPRGGPGAVPATGVSRVGRSRAIPGARAGPALSRASCHPGPPLRASPLRAMAAVAWGRCLPRVWLRRRAGPGCGRHFRAALCAELKQPLAIEEVASCPVRPHEVIAAAGSDEKCRLAMRKGAQSIVNYSQRSLKEAVRKLVGSDGVNMVIDAVGGDVFLEALRSLAWEGRIVVVGFAGGTIASVPANLLLLKNVSAMGLYWGRYKEQNFPVFSRILSSALQYCQQGRIQPHIGAVFKLEEVNDAFLHVIQRKSMGKSLFGRSSVGTISLKKEPMQLRVTVFIRYSRLSPALPRRLAAGEIAPTHLPLLFHQLWVCPPAHTCLNNSSEVLTMG